jgi:hypothetical protein
MGHTKGVHYCVNIPMIFFWLFRVEDLRAILQDMRMPTEGCDSRDMISFVYMFLQDYIALRCLCLVIVEETRCLY